MRLIYNVTLISAVIRLCALVTQACLTLCDPMDCNPPGFSVRGILQAKIQEWVAISSSRGSSLHLGIEPASPVSPALAGRFFYH